MVSAYFYELLRKSTPKGTLIRIPQRLSLQSCLMQGADFLREHLGDGTGPLLQRHLGQRVNREMQYIEPFKRTTPEPTASHHQAPEARFQP